ncbi:hypothetical protein ACQ5SO_17325 [Rhodovulum sp. DZ06]|uniref:hypothetical protein n=1 Tax=Rhodovulum sp. DZ06 TaxID=3425126 RepID=UPI003D3525C5
MEAFDVAGIIIIPTALIIAHILSKNKEKDIDRLKASVGRQAAALEKIYRTDRNYFDYLHDHSTWSKEHLDLHLRVFDISENDFSVSISTHGDEAVHFPKAWILSTSKHLLRVLPAHEQDDPDPARPKIKSIERDRFVEIYSSRGRIFLDPYK